MNKQSGLSKKLLVWSVLFLAISIAEIPSAFANPTDALLLFKYKPDGTFAVNVQLDSPVTTRCIARHKSSLYYEGDESGDASVKRVASHSRILPKGRISTSLRAFGLPGATQKNGADPIIAVQVQIVCSNSTERIISNTEARFVRCGDKRARRVSLDAFFNQLKKKLQFSK